MVVLPAKTLFKYRAMDYKSLAILLWSLVYWSNSLASKGWTLLALCPSLPSIMDHVIQSFTKPHHAMPRLAWMLQPEPSCAFRDNYPSHQSSPRETIDQNTDILFTPIFWFTLIKETKVKDHVKWRIPLGSQWPVSACLPPPHPHPPGLNDTALVKRITKERVWLLTSCCSWLAPGQPLSSCLLFTTDMGISIFCPTKIKRRCFLITGDTIMMNLI